MVHEDYMLRIIINMLHLFYFLIFVQYIGSQLSLQYSNNVL
jgi:hypothetical protein